MGREGTVAVAALASLAVVALVVFALRDEREPQAPPPPDGLSATMTEAVRPEAEPPSPFSTEGGAFAPESVATRRPTVVAPPSPNASEESTTPDVPVDVTSLGREEFDDDALEALVARLAADPDLLTALVDEFRSESDPVRLARLARLLGEVGGPETTALAAELVYAADDERRDIGLDLLRRVQPGNEEARDIISGLLSNGTDRSTLLPVLNTLARPGVVPFDERTRLAGQISVLSAHEDPVVRRIGLGVLSRWSEGDEHVALMRDGLGDAHPGVREAAAHALVGRPDPDGTLVRELFGVADDPGEEERVRRAAILALKNQPLGGADLERRLTIERELDRRPIR